MILQNEVYNFSPEVGSGPHFTLLKTQPPSKRLVPKPEGLCGGSVMELGEGEVGTPEFDAIADQLRVALVQGLDRVLGVLAKA